MPRRVCFVLAACALLLAGCGDDTLPPIVPTEPRGTADVRTPIAIDTPTPDDSAERWVAGVCGALTTWRTGLDREAAAVSDGPVPGDVAEAREAALRFLDNVIRETDRLVAHLQALDPPGVRGGTAIAALVTGSVQEVRRTFDDARRQMRAVSPGDAEAYVEALAATQDALSGAGLTLATSLAAIDRQFDTSELSRILVATRECDTP